MMVIDNKFEYGQTVYLKTDKGQLPRIVTAIHLRGQNITYCLSQGTGETVHHDIEISEEINVVLKTTE